MDCDTFFERIDALLEGQQLADDHALGHLERCGDCARLLAALRAADGRGDDPSLSEAILARTSGAPCASARSRLCPRLDGELDAVEAALVERHLARCPDCAGLAWALERAEQELPRLAAIDPGPRFTEAVLARTSRREARTSRWEGAGARVGSFFAELLARRNIAWEGALVATAVLVVLVLLPGSPVAGFPNQALDLVRDAAPGHRRALGRLRGTVNELEATLVSGANAAWAGARQRLGTFPGSAASAGDRDES